jgi:hypothetical protein
MYALTAWGTFLSFVSKSSGIKLHLGSCKFNKQHTEIPIKTQRGSTLHQASFRDVDFWHPAPLDYEISAEATKEE